MDIFKKVLVLKALVKYLLLKGCLTNLYQKMLRLIGENLLLLSWVNLSFQSKFTNDKSAFYGFGANFTIAKNGSSKINANTKNDRFKNKQISQKKFYLANKSCKNN